MRARVLAGSRLGGVSRRALGRVQPSVRRYAMSPALPDSPSPPRSRGCADVPKAAELKKLLQAAPSQNGDAGGLNHGKAMWGAIVNRDGELCALAASTDDAAATWPGSRGIAIAKAFTANAFSSDTSPLSTARLYTLSQPGHSLWSIANGNPLNAELRWAPRTTPARGIGKVCGGTIAFGGGLRALQGTDPRRRPRRQRRHLVRRPRDRQAGAAVRQVSRRPVCPLTTSSIRRSTDRLPFAHPLCANTFRDG